MIKGTKRLAQRYNMDPAALDRRLQAARDEYQRNTSKAIPKKEEVKNVLKPIAKNARKLFDGLRNLNPVIYSALDHMDGEESQLDNLQLQLLYLLKNVVNEEESEPDGTINNKTIVIDGGRIQEVMNGWSKPKLADTARNMAILRVTQAWKQLTNKPATFSNPKNKPDRKSYSGNLNGDFLDFLTDTCESIGVDRHKYSADAIARQFVKLKSRNKELL